ncbi:MAG: NAD(P)/FAD-dependent oxidoreductase [Dehalococcoidia bacterium]|nr:MAG: NAD(P)/FAD-dependent oxidoreductase [Dehalococcoidia bacterium]
MSSADWDAIVIGAGLGGLTAAAYLATNGQRVLVLEQHYVAGGNAHVFRRKRDKRTFEFDVGVHYIGDCAPGGAIPNVLRGIGLDDKIEFLELDPDGFDTVLFPGVTFRVPKGWDKYRERLVAAFPDDETGLHRCLDVFEHLLAEVRKLYAAGAAPDLAQLLPQLPTLLRWGGRALSDLFDDCGLGAKARAVIIAQSGAYAVAPSRTPVAVHAAFLDHYLKGAYYPRGGGQVLPARLVEVLRANGGELRTRQRVDRILIEDGRATGVRLTSGEELRAPTVISNADLKRTLLQMVGAEHVSPSAAARVDAYRMALPIFCVYLGLDIDLRGRMPNTNYWYCDSFDLEDVYQTCYDGRLPEHFPLLITAASVKDPHTRRIAPPGCSSIEIMTWVPANYDVWSVHEGPAAGEKYHRDRDYRSNKDRLTELMIDGAENALPGIREHIVWKEAATPITQERYTLSTGGTSYGIEMAVDQSGPARPAPATEIPGLFLTGASTTSGHGIVGAMRGGVATAGAILGHDVMREVEDGRIFGDPSKLTSGPDWDPWQYSR